MTESILLARKGNDTQFRRVAFYLLVRDAFTLIEAAVTKPQRQTAAPGGASKPMQSGPPNVPPPVAKTTRVFRAADLSSKSYLETEADVDAYVAKLKGEPRAVILAAQMASVQ